MKNILKKIFLIILVFALMLNLNGCWDRKELDTLGIIMGIGIDKAEEINGVDMTFEFAVVSNKNSSSDSTKSSSSSKSKSTNGQYLNIHNTGKDFCSVVSDLSHTVNRNLIFSHNQVIILGEDLAKDGIRDTLDFYSRYYETRMNVYVFIAKGKAADIFETEPGFDEMPATEISRLMEDQKNMSGIVTNEAYEITRTFLSETNSAVVPIIEIKEENGEKKFQISGSCVIKDGKAVGELNNLETRGYQWGMGEMKNGLLNVELLGISAELQSGKTKSKITPAKKLDGTIYIKIEIEEEENLCSQTGPVNLANVIYIEQLQQKSEQLIKDEVQNTIKKANELKADIFGFGEAINKKYPKEWKSLKPRWGERLKDIEVEITVKSKVRGTGRISSPFYEVKE